MPNEIAKSAPTSTPSAPVVHPTPPESVFMYNGMPLDILDYFNVDYRKVDDRAQMQIEEIYGVCKKGCNTIGDVMLKIRRIERKVGQPSLTETRYGKVWSYLRIGQQISELEKRRKSLEG